MNFTIVIPTRDRILGLQNLLSCIALQQYPLKKLQIIIVDNSSTQTTKQLNRNLVKEFSNILLITYLISRPAGPSISRNLGIRHAKYSHILFLDDDLYIPKNLIAEYSKIWSVNPQAAVIGGQVHFQFPKKNIPSFHVNPEFYWVFAGLNLGSKVKLLAFPESLYSANLSIRLNAFPANKRIFNESLGRRYGFNICLFGEDVELCWNLLLNHQKIIYNPGLIVTNIIGEEKLQFYYYYSRIIKGGIERFLIDTILKSKYPDYQNFPYRKVISDHFRAFRHNLIRSRKTSHALFEYLVYTLGYLLFSRLFIPETNTAKKIILTK